MDLPASHDAAVCLWALVKLFLTTRELCGLGDCRPFFLPKPSLAHMKKTQSKKSIEGLLLVVLLLAGLYGAMYILRGQDEQPGLASPGEGAPELVIEDRGY